MAEVAGFLGHKMERFATTEIYARYAPNYRSAAVRAIDDFFWELSPLLARTLLGFRLEDQPTPDDLRAHALSPGSDGPWPTSVPPGHVVRVQTVAGYCKPLHPGRDG
jgi:hypothetical protein